MDTEDFNFTETADDLAFALTAAKLAASILEDHERELADPDQFGDE